MGHCDCGHCDHEEEKECDCECKDEHKSTEEKFESLKKAITVLGYKIEETKDGIVIKE